MAAVGMFGQRSWTALQQLARPLVCPMLRAPALCRHASEMTGQDKALALLRHFPDVSYDNIKYIVKQTKPGRRRGRYGGKTHGFGQKGSKARQKFTPAGHDGHRMPYYMKVPSDEPYRGQHMRRQYLPVSLHEIQLMIDVDRIDISLPIDITQLCRTGLYKVDPLMREFGFQLTDVGMDYFKAPVHLEVQYASERVIAAVEKAGGSVTTAFYDALCIKALSDPEQLFKNGTPIPRRTLPPQDAVAYYCDPAARGYLADPALVAGDRLALAQKYGYQLTEEQMTGVHVPLKDPRQIFYGLEPGWLVNLADKTVHKTSDETFSQYYRS